MRILWVKVGGLWPLNSGGRLRSYHILKELSRRHPVVVLTTHGPGDGPEELAEQLSGCAGVVSLPHAAPKQGSPRFAASLLASWLSPLPVDLWKWRVAGLRAAVDRLIKNRDADLCVADFLTAVPNVPLRGPVPVMFFDHNVEHLIWRRLSRVEDRLWRRLPLEVEWRKMRRWEARACARADMTLAVSEADRDLLVDSSPGARVRAIPTGVDTEYFVPGPCPEEPASLVFTGSMDWHPNEDGIRHFASQVLPLVRRQVPEVTVTVVGRSPGPGLRAAAAAAGIRVTGAVADVRPYVSRASLYVVPLRVGGGTRLKIFEALAMGKAVVSTSVGAEGLPVVPGRHLLIEDDPAAFAGAVVSLLEDPERRAALGAAGRRLVEERHSWAHVAREFEARCQEVVTDGAS
jgi:glycosyltransferase involved in cell wall biosynthesis